MGENVILRHDAWKQMDTGDLFDITFITADRRRGTGGQRITFASAQKIKREAIPDSIPLTQQMALKKEQKLIKDPNHGVNKTINIHVPNDRSVHVHKLHYRLFTWFNGKRVIQ